MKPLTIISIISGLVIFGCTPGPSEQTGETLYAEYCQPCHGIDGTGDGQLVYLLYPKPRDLTSGLYKLRSTREGQLPNDDDLFRTIRAGMQGTSMPSFRFLGDEKIQKIVDYIKEFDPGFEDEPREPIDVPEPLPYSERLVAIGEKTYTELGCHRCHGDTGTGDGPSAGELKDAWGYPIYVRDFTRGYYLGGYEPEDLYLRFIAGMSGTPMPSYEGSLSFIADTDEELQEMLWGLIHYVKDLETEEARALRVDEPGGGVIPASKIDLTEKEQLSDPVARHWDDVPVYHIPVSRLWQSVHDDAGVINVRAVYSDSHIALLLEWRDDKQAASALRPQDYHDAAAAQFSLSDNPGFHGMGSREKPVDIWFWRASWQMYVDKGISPDIEYAYGGRASDAVVDDFPEFIDEYTFLPGINAGNPVSRYDIESPVEAMNAVGPETTTSRPAADQDVDGKGVWNGETWRVVFVRELTTDSDTSVQFTGNDPYWISFAVWDGDAGDRDGLKKVSTWYRLVFE
jgi:mono/diheme cytochrome c family protein